MLYNAGECVYLHVLITPKNFSGIARTSKEVALNFSIAVLFMDTAEFRSNHSDMDIKDNCSCKLRYKMLIRMPYLTNSYDYFS
jgi:hypothetical protein